MESFDALSTLAEKSAGCEQILMPSTNGAACDEVTGIEYLEEHDPMADITDLDQLQQQRKANKSLLHDLSIEENDEDDEEPMEDVDNDDDIEDVEGEQLPLKRTPTQVPKKRKDAAMLAAAEEDTNEEKPTNKQTISLKKDKTQVEEQEQPTSSARAAAAKENSVDEDQCRVCTIKDDLVSLFKQVERLTVAEMLMTICPAVSIARKDFMPQYICNPCLDNVTIAVQLKTQCETTERELRKKLSRSKNKVRRPTGFVIIDAPVESDPPSEEEPNDDAEFHVSDVEISASVDEDDSDSDFDKSSSKKRRTTRSGGGGGGSAKRGGRRKSAVATPPAVKSKPKEKKRMGRPPTKRPPPPQLVADASSDEEAVIAQPQKKKNKRTLSSGEKDVLSISATATPDKPTEFPCDECEQVFTRKLSLVLHKKVHGGGREPINCEVCGKQFKIQGAYRTHLEKHKEDDKSYHCTRCDAIFAGKSELRRHMTENHDEPGEVHQCDKCRRTFVSEVRLARHKDGRCPGAEGKAQRQRFDYEGLAVGKDLFKTVAPLTTTYWSDSFSD